MQTCNACVHIKKSSAVSTLGGAAEEALEADCGGFDEFGGASLRGAD